MTSKGHVDDKADSCQSQRLHEYKPHHLMRIGAESEPNAKLPSPLSNGFGKHRQQAIRFLPYTVAQIHLVSHSGMHPIDDGGRRPLS